MEEIAARLKKVTEEVRGWWQRESVSSWKNMMQSAFDPLP
jgi:hypothetical protein